MQDSPRVSVIMGAHNCEGTITAAIQSVFDQTYQNWELIVCDDGSTDTTAARLRKLADESPKPFTLVRTEVNRGLAYSLNKCLAASSAPLVARMDADDLSNPGRFRIQVDFLESHPDIDLVGTAMQRFSDEGCADLVTPPRSPDRWTLLSSVPFCHATIMARREVFDVLGGYVVADRTRRAEDLDLWFRFFHAGFKGANLDEPLYLVREDPRALQRRTARSRFQSTYLTTIAGYRLLDYPPSAYLRPTMALAKGLVPHVVVRSYRRWQKHRFERSIAQDPAS